MSKFQAREPAVQKDTPFIDCIAEYSRSAGVSPTLTLKKTQLWGPDLSGTPQGAGGVGGLLSQSLISNPQSPIYYPTYDGNGNISEYLASNGTIAAHFEYDPFGNTVVNTDTGNLFTYRFSTKPRDQETGLYYYGYRYYDPTTGRWLNRDSIEEKGGVSLYGFVENSGIGKIDVLGQGFWGDLWDELWGNLPGVPPGTGEAVATAKIAGLLVLLKRAKEADAALRACLEKNGGDVNCCKGEEAAANAAMDAAARAPK